MTSKTVTKFDSAISAPENNSENSEKTSYSNNNIGEGGVKTQSPVDMLYEKFTSVFGNSNQKQLFSLIWPGTILDYDTFKIPEHHTGPIPPTVQIAQSQLFDIHYPTTPITQPDGTRISDRYKQAVETYGARPNERLLDIQRVIQERLNQLTELSIDGKMTTVTLLEKFSFLQDECTKRKQEWSILKSNKLEKLKTTGDVDWWEQYIQWYENIAESYIDGINAAYNRMLADFPVNEFEDALTILDTHDAAALLRAKQDVRNSLTLVPAEIGQSIFVANAIPPNWGNALKPSTVFTDLLASPEAQQRYLDLCIEQLSQQVFAWNAVIAQIPLVSKDDLEKALNEFRTASNEYTAASNNLIKSYTDNTVLAVKIYMQYKQANPDQKASAAVKLSNSLCDADGSKKGPDKLDWATVAKDVGDAQKKLVDDTTGMVGCGARLAEKATAFLNTKAGEGLREMIQPILAKFQSQLEILVRQIQNLDSSAGRAIKLNETFETSLDVATNESKQNPVFASPVDSIFNQRWQEVTMTVKKSDMGSSSQTSTSFSSTNWGVDLFFGSAGGKDSTASADFAAKFLDEESEIQIGMLATKVLIERPWMHPEIFNMTQKFFKAVDTDIISPKEGFSSEQLLASGLGGKVSEDVAGKNCVSLNSVLFPGYSVALLLVKDVTIKIKCSVTKTAALQKHFESNSNAGGGFFCFSVSRTQSRTEDSKSVDSHAMAGEFVFRIPAPQIVGVWNQIMPTDKAEFLSQDEIERSLKFNIPRPLIQSVSNLKPHKEVPPAKK